MCSSGIRQSAGLMLKRDQRPFECCWWFLYFFFFLFPNWLSSFVGRNRRIGRLLSWFSTKYFCIFSTSFVWIRPNWMVPVPVVCYYYGTSLEWSFFQPLSSFLTDNSCGRTSCTMRGKLPMMFWVRDGVTMWAPRPFPSTQPKTNPSSEIDRVSSNQILLLFNNPLCVLCGRAEKLTDGLDSFKCEKRDNTCQNPKTRQPRDQRCPALTWRPSSFSWYWPSWILKAGWANLAVTLQSGKIWDWKLWPF